MPFCRGYDVIQQAQSGTGKTATFCAGVLQQARVVFSKALEPRADTAACVCVCVPQLDYSLLQTQALVLGPTRELAQQIEKARAMATRMPLKCALADSCPWLLRVTCFCAGHARPG